MYVTFGSRCASGLSSVRHAPGKYPLWTASPSTHVTQTPLPSGSFLVTVSAGLPLLSHTTWPTAKVVSLLIVGSPLLLYIPLPPPPCPAAPPPRSRTGAESPPCC